jgi:xylulokinase
MAAPVLAIDIGSTRMKASLVDAGGRLLSVVAQASPLSAARVEPGPLLAVVADLALQACGPVRPSAIAITGATRSVVCTGHDGAALGPLIKLDDPRGAQFEGALQRAYGAPGPRGLGAGHPLARALDLQAQEPARYGQMRWLLELKDWINLQLTGRAACDSMAQARVAPSPDALARLLATLGLTPGLCAGAQEPGQTLGRVRADAGAWARWQGVPVAQCGFDAWCASFGMGCVHEHAIYNVCGTTEVFGSFCSGPRAVAGVACLPWGAGLFHLGGPCLTGLGTLAWFGERFLGRADPAAVLACAARAGEDTPLCLPFVSGERMPFWRDDLRASFTQVHSGHGLPEMAGALVDGLLVFQSWLLRRMEPTPQAVYLSGGGATLDGWARRKASAFGTPVRLVDCAEPGLAGAALCAQVALGVHGSLALAQAALAPGWQAVEPQAAQTRRLRAAEQRLVPLLEALDGR